jgi:hypothetical protein
MKSYRKELWFNTPQRVGFINITGEVLDCLRDSGIREGLALVNAMHITASVFINDDEHGLHGDFERWLEELAPHAPLIIDLPMENHSIDEMVEVLNRNLLFRFTAGYSENTNTLHFSTANFSASLVIGPLTTGGDLIGFAPETRTSSGRTTRPAASTWRAPPHSTYAPASGRGTGTPATWAIPP